MKPHNGPGIVLLSSSTLNTAISDPSICISYRVEVIEKDRYLGLEENHNLPMVHKVIKFWTEHTNIFTLQLLCLQYRPVISDYVWPESERPESNTTWHIHSQFVERSQLHNDCAPLWKRCKLF
jgi:hypothetical protein